MVRGRPCSAPLLCCRRAACTREDARTLRSQPAGSVASRADLQSGAARCCMGRARGRAAGRRPLKSARTTMDPPYEAGLPRASGGARRTARHQHGLAQRRGHRHLRPDGWRAGRPRPRAR
eukprot:12157182-Ditylum_brightwellii.AAC.1